jgi:hypothetical protein
MLTLKNLSTALILFSILYLFYLKYVNRLNIPLSIIIMITVGSLLSAISCNTKHDYAFFNPKIFNYIITLVGIVIIVKEYMWKLKYYKNNKIL